MAEPRIIPVNTIPLPKLAMVMNNFIGNTINHLNKLSVKGDEKLAEFDNKLNDLDIMTTLLESKLNSLPEKITSTYPEPNHGTNLQPQPGTDSGTGPSVPPPPPPPPPPDPDNDSDEEKEDEEEQKDKKGENGDDNMSPKDSLENFLKQHENLRNISKMLKYGASSIQTEQKARMNGIDMNLFKELLEKVKKAYPNIN